MLASTQAFQALRVQQAPRSANRRAACVVRAESGSSEEQASRRSVLSLFAAGAALVAAQPALALNAINPAQNSYGGLSRSTGKAVNSSYASMEGYTLEGTKKTGASVKRRASVLEEARKEAESQAQAESKPAKK